MITSICDYFSSSQKSKLVPSTVDNLLLLIFLLVIIGLQYVPPNFQVQIFFEELCTDVRISVIMQSIFKHNLVIWFYIYSLSSTTTKSSRTTHKRSFAIFHGFFTTIISASLFTTTIISAALLTGIISAWFHRPFHYTI